MPITISRVVTKAVIETGRFSRWLWYTQFLYRWMRVGRKVTFAGPLECLGMTGEVSIGDRCYVGPWVSLSVGNGGLLTIGADTSLNKGTVVSALAQVVIGQGCRIAENVSIRDNDHRVALDSPIKDSGFVVQPVSIGDNVWIGRNATIRLGVTIGSGAVVGAHSFVNSDIPPFAIAVGTPARVMRSRLND